MISEKESDNSFFKEEAAKKYSELIMKEYNINSEIYVTELQLKEIIKDAFLEGIYYNGKSL